MKRKIKAGSHLIQSVSEPANFSSDPIQALSDQAKSHGMRWLLAHADDGVIWGEFRDDELHLSSDPFPGVSPPLRAETLQQARLFGPRSELLLWRDDVICRGRLIQDCAGEPCEYYDEAHLLWGNKAEREKDGFVLLRQGKEGLRHAPPVSLADRLPVRLKVRHYLAYDEDGQAHVVHSRLVAIGGEE